jgi:hypothetical protein
MSAALWAPESGGSRNSRSELCAISNRKNQIGLISKNFIYENIAASQVEISQLFIFSK